MKSEKGIEVVGKNRRELRAPKTGRRDLLKMGLLAGASLLIPKLGLSAPRPSVEGFLDQESQSQPTTSLMQIIRRQRLGNDTEDISNSPSQSADIAILDGYDVLGVSLSPPLAIVQSEDESSTASRPLPMRKLFDVLNLEIKAAPRGIAYIDSRNQFVFSDTLQTATLFLTDSTGRPRKQINIQYPTDATPQAVEGLEYIPRTAPQFPDHLVLATSFLNDDSELEARLEIINLDGQVVREIVPQGDLASVFLTGVCFKLPGTLVVSSDDDETIYELDFDGNVLASYDGSAQPSLNGIEGLAQTRDGRIAAASGFDGAIATFDLSNDLPPRPVLDYRIGLGLSLPSGIAWDSSTNQLLLISLNREEPGSQFISAVAPTFVTSNTVIPVDVFTRKLTFLPDEQLIAVTHTNNPRGILLFDRKGQSAGQINTSQFGIPQVITYIPGTREFVLVFRDTQDPSKTSKLFVLTRKGEFSRIIDLVVAGVTRITAATFFNPAHPSGGQFLVVDGPTNMAVVTDFAGAVLDKFSIRDTLGLLTPTAVTAITTTRDAGAFAISNGENSEIVVFRLG